MVVETGTFAFARDVDAVLAEVRRVSGGRMLSGGGMRSVLWKRVVHRAYSAFYPSPLCWSFASFDYEKDDCVRYERLGTEEKREFRWATGGRREGEGEGGEGGEGGGGEQERTGLLA